MFSWLSSISDTIISIVELVKNTLSNIISFLALIPKYLVFASRASEQLPVMLVPFAALAISVMVFRFIIDR